MDRSGLVRALRNELLAAAQIASRKMEAERMGRTSQIDIAFEKGLKSGIGQFHADLRELQRALSYFATAVDPALAHVTAARSDLDVYEVASAGVRPCSRVRVVGP